MEGTASVPAGGWAGPRSGWCAEVRSGFRYVRSLLVHSLPSAAVGIVFGAIPLGLCSNWAARMLVAKPRGEGHVWATTLIATTWTDADVAACDPVSYYTFWSARVLVSWGYAWIPVAIFSCLWTGPRRWPLLAAAAGSLVHSAMAWLRMLAYSRGILHAPGLHEPLFYVHMALVTAMYSGTMLLAAPVGHRRSSIGGVYAAVSIFGVYIFVQFLRTLRKPGWFVHTLALLGLTSVRGVAVHLAVHAALRLPEASPNAQVFLTIILFSVPTAAIAVLQVSGTDPMRVALLYLLLMASELCKNVGMLQGYTEVESLWAMVVAGSRGCQRLGSGTWGQEARSFTAVVPEQSVPDILAADPEQKPLPPLAPRIWEAVEQTTVHDARKLFILTETVASSNSLELVTLLCAAALFLVAKVNPTEPHGEPLAWTTVLANLSLGLGTELLTDFVTGALASRLQPAAPGGRAAAESHGGERRPIVSAAISLVVLLATLESFSSMLLFMCPSPVAGTTELLSISACPASV